jgi:hypothetical protein
MASPDTHLRNTRSTNVITVQERLEITSGSATFKTSLPPEGRFHQLAFAPFMN